MKIGDKLTHNGCEYRIKSDFGCGEYVIETVQSDEVEREARIYAEGCIMGDLDRPNIYKARMQAFLVGAKCGTRKERERTQKRLSVVCDIPEVYLLAIARLLEE